MYTKDNRMAGCPYSMYKLTWIYFRCLLLKKSLILPYCNESTKSMKSVAKYNFKTKYKYFLHICKVQVSDTQAKHLKGLDKEYRNKGRLNSITIWEVFTKC